MNIILAGMPGSGKTTVCKVFKKLGKTVYDTDEEIVKKHGRIADIFARYGEAYFRNLETETVKELSGKDGAVIATGGGCLLRSENVEIFKKSGVIVFLRTGPETLLSRVEGDTERPLLQGDTKDKLNRLYKERSHIYESAADVIVDTDNLTPEQIAKEILEKI